MDRQAVYRGLLSAIGRYFFHEASINGYDEWVDFDTDGAYKTILDWVEAGERPHVRAFHVWGVGQAAGGSRGDHAYSYCKDRHIKWDGEAWVVEESNKYVVDATGATPAFYKRAPETFAETRRVVP